MYRKGSGGFQSKARSRAMSKRSRSHSPPRHSSARAAKRPSHRRQHLYVLLEDWERGCSIYKVDEDDLDTDSDTEIETPSPIARIEARHPLAWSFASHGTTIMAVRQGEGSLAIPGFDTETMGVTLCPLPRTRRSRQNPKPLYVSLGDRLFVMVGQSVELLGPRPPLPAESDGAVEPWSWSSVSTHADFSSEDVTGYAVHPDGRTVFMSETRGTYSFDTRRHEFRHHGDWMLPFRGQAHYDGELDAWVGLAMSREGSGRVCSCDVPSSRATARCEAMPDWKISQDEVFDCRWGWHRGVTLVYMGGSRYCVVRCCAHRDEWKVPYPSHRVMQMTTFDLKYGKNGELRINARRGRVSMPYKVPREFRVGPTLHLDPTAFWM